MILIANHKMESVRTVGRITGSACHLNAYVTGLDVFELSCMDTITRDIVLWRSGLSTVNTNATICSHHK